MAQHHSNAASIVFLKTPYYVRFSSTPVSPKTRIFAGLKLCMGQVRAFKQLYQFNDDLFYRLMITL